MDKDKKSKTWKKGEPRNRRGPSSQSKIFQETRQENFDYDDNVLSLPARADNRRIVFEEIVICTLIGIIPSFVWAISMPHKATSQRVGSILSLEVFSWGCVLGYFGVLAHQPIWRMTGCGIWSELANR